MAPPFPGVADPAERKQIIAYLKSDTTPAPAKQGRDGTAEARADRDAVVSVSLARQSRAS